MTIPKSKSPTIHVFTLNSIHFSPILLFFFLVIVSWEEGNSTDEFHFLLLLRLLSVLRHSGLLLFLLFPLTAECLMSFSPFPFPYVWYQYLFFQKPRRKKLSKIFAYILNDLHLGSPRVPLIWEFAVGRAFYFFRVVPSFVSYSFSFYTRPGVCGSHKALEQFQTLMESSSD